MLRSTKHLIFRYLSHELLTPLNAAILGIQLAAKRLKDTNGDEFVREMVADTQVSLVTAVEFFEFLSQQDKLEHGTLKLDTSDVLVIPMLAECVKTVESNAIRQEVPILLKTTVGIVSNGSDKGKH
jgi:signal transduction histidine kinase